MQEEYATEAGRRQRVGVFAAVHLEEYEARNRPATRVHPPGPQGGPAGHDGGLRRQLQPHHGDVPRSRRRADASCGECIANREPDCTASAPGGVSYKMWLLNEDSAAQRLHTLLKSAPIYIADGHHRYETALAYRDIVRGRERVRLDTQASGFVLMCLVEFDDPGMQLHSFHRALSGLSPEKLSALQEQVYGLFTVESRPLGGMNVERMGEFLDATWRMRGGKPALGLIEPEEGRLSVLSLRGNLGPGTLPHAPSPEMYKCEAWLLHSSVLDPVLGGSSGDQSQVDFVPELERAPWPYRTGRVPGGIPRSATGHVRFRGARPRGPAAASQDDVLPAQVAHGDRDELAHRRRVARRLAAPPGPGQA